MHNPILYQSPALRQPLNGDAVIPSEKFRLPAVAGEEENLPVLSRAPEIPQGGGTAGVVKIGQG